MGRRSFCLNPPTSGRVRVDVQEEGGRLDTVERRGLRALGLQGIVIGFREFKFGVGYATGYGRCRRHMLVTSD